MTLQGDPEPQNAPTESRSRFRRSTPGTFKAAVLAGALVAAIAMTPPLPDQARGSSGTSAASVVLDFDPIQRQVAPAVVSPRAGPAVPADTTPAPAVEAPAAEATSAEPPAEPPPAVVVPPSAPVPPVEAAPQPPATEPPSAQPGWTIYVAGSGGQDLVDACIGPVHFTPTDAYSLFITEHDYCGGWERFSGINVGQTVTLAGYGSYTVDALGQVPLGGTTNHVSAVFGGFPKAVLQTCIPGTSQILVIALN